VVKKSLKVCLIEQSRSDPQQKKRFNPRLKRLRIFRKTRSVLSGRELCFECGDVAVLLRLETGGQYGSWGERGVVDLVEIGFNFGPSRLETRGVAQMEFQLFQRPDVRVHGGSVLKISIYNLWLSTHFYLLLRTNLFTFYEIEGHKKMNF
jgi:hypothetical protein